MRVVVAVVAMTMRQQQQQQQLEGTETTNLQPTNCYRSLTKSTILLLKSLLVIANTSQ